jgi:predicted MFS family arabinose efflux permease
VVSQAVTWSQHALRAVVLAAGAALAFAAWGARERRAAAPLVDLTLLRHPAVLGANAAMLAGGAGMYLLLTLITRYAQTPASTGYGFGLSTFVAGLVLVPFSVLGFAGGRLTPRLPDRGPAVTLAAGAGTVCAAFVFFALARGGLAELFAAMAVLGLGVGSFSAARPGVILAVTPQGETSSAMSFNQVVRSAGFSLGSAAGGFILAASTRPGQVFPAGAGYSTAAWAGAGLMAATAGISLTLGRQCGAGRDGALTGGPGQAGAGQAGTGQAG